MIKSFFLLCISTALFANSDYIPFSKFSQNKNVENSFTKVQQKTKQKKYTNFKKQKTNYTYINNSILKNTLEISTSLSNFNSKSEQYIYNLGDGRKISQLTWNADNVKLFGFIFLKLLSTFTNLSLQPLLLNT